MHNEPLAVTASHPGSAYRIYPSLHDQLLDLAELAAKVCRASKVSIELYAPAQIWEGPPQRGAPGTTQQAASLEIALQTGNGPAVGVMRVFGLEDGACPQATEESLQCVARLVLGLLNTSRLQQEAERASLELDALLEELPGGVVTCDADGNLARFNRAARNWHGADPRSMPPEQWSVQFDLFEGDGHTHMATDRIPLRRAFMGDVIDNQLLVIKAKGQPPRSVQCSGRQLTSPNGERIGAMIVMHDITELRQIQSAWKHAMGRLEAIINASSDVAIVATDTEGRINLFNTGAQMMLGYAEGEMIGKTPEVFHLGSEVAQRARELSAETGLRIHGFEAFVHKSRSQTSETLNWTYVCKDGSHKTVRLAVSAVREPKGGIVGFLGVAVDITNLLAAQQNAWLSSRRFSGAFDSAANGMALVSLQGHWIEVNESLCKHLGYNRAELENLTFQDITHPDDLQLDMNLVQALMNDNIKHYTMEKRYLRKNRQWMWARLAVALVRDEQGEPVHFVSQITDITRERETQEALKESEARLRGLFERTPLGIVLHDANTGQILDSNPTMTALSGHSPYALREMNLLHLTPLEHQAREMAAISELFTNGDTQYGPLEKDLLTANGNRLPVRQMGSMVRDPRGDMGVVWTVVEDISEHRRIEKLQREFIATVSHELRTPLSSINGALLLLKSGVTGDLNEEQTELVDMGVSNGERLLKIVNDLLDMEKLLAGKMNIQIADLALMPLIKESVKQMTPYAERFDVRLQMRNRTACMVQADPDRLLQVLANLLGNASRHSPAGGSVQVEHSVLPTGEVLISIINPGEGIPMHVRQRLFQKFVQAHDAKGAEHRGTGLGLSICKALIERMGGVIGYESFPGYSTRFWFKLRGKKVEPRKLNPTPSILCMDTDADFARFLGRHMEHMVSKFDTVSTLSAAEELLSTRHYDLIFMNTELDDGNARAIIPSIQIYCADIPVVVTSGHDLPFDMANNVVAIFTRDELNIDALVAQVRQLLNHAEVLA
ncbi:PAS domain S-box protein [Limnobacter sp.]|uniref:PAS domain S-box protein n=1 Tax=Limnobacter sp. TaxID=2003368 RepID=UPI003516F49E